MNKVMLGVAGLVGAFGMVSAGLSQTEAQHNMGPMMQMMQNCPMQVHGAKVAVTDTTVGVDVTITTESGNVDELRRRVEYMAKMHSAHESKRHMGGANPGPTGRDHQMMRPTSMIAGTVTYEPVPNGAKLTLIPKDPGQLEAFRKQVREHAERMKKGDCPMMQGMEEGMRRQTPDLEEGGDHSHHPQ
jgi:hypothetical protein